MNVCLVATKATRGAGARPDRSIAGPAVILAALVAAGCTGAHEPPAAASKEPAGQTTQERKPAYYRNPMDPSRTSPVPMKDEMGMDYVPVYLEDSGTEVRVSPAVMNNLGVRVTAATRGPLPQTADTVGYVSYDERRVRQVRPRAEGWVESLAVRVPGEQVRAGGTLFTLYSPALETAQQEYLDALRIGNRDLIEASRERLTALGLEPGTADRLAKAGRVSGRVTYTSPIGGVLTELGVREGSMVTPDTVAATITGLGSLWVMAEVPEAQAGWIVAGTSARLEFPSLPGRVVAGHVEYVYPELDRETRTLRARIVLDDAPAAVRPNMLSTVTLVGTPGPEVVSVPRSALIRTGSGDRVVIALGEGRFAPRPVVAGAESGDRIAITEGLAAGEQVVVAGQFLIDSEANLRAALGRLDAGAPGSGADPEHAGH
jgi:Cu(I)/Ag(I) efflux system membrane fusion protein